LTTAYTLANATTVSFTSAPGNGVAIRIYRETNADTPQATFFAGSAIRAQDLNDNFSQVLYNTQETVDRRLDRSGGTMSGAINMGNHKITNLGTPTNSTDASTKAYVDSVVATGAANAAAAAASASAAAASATAAANTYDAFDDRYLGSKASDPTLDNDGNALSVGALYFNSSQQILKAWTGAEWVISAAAGNIIRWRKTATAGATVLSGVDDLGTSLTYAVGNEQVFLNGALQTRAVDYTAATGNSITFTVPLLAGDIVELHAVQGYVSATITPGSINDALVAPAAGIQYSKLALSNSIVNADVNATAGIVASKLSFTQAGTGAIVRSIDSKLKDWVSVEDFGAFGNDTANDTAAIQAAITSLSSGGTVYFPAGTYKCDGVLTISNANVRLQGVGREGAKLRFTTIGTNTNAITISANNVTISGLTIQGPQAGTYVANANGIYGNGSSGSRLSRIRIEDCEIYNFGSYGIELDFCDNTAVCNNYIHDIGYAGFHLRSGITSLIDGNVVDNITPGTSGNMYGITVSHTSTGYNVGLPANEKAATNHFCIGVNITNNEVTRVAWEGIDAHGGFEINVSNNRLYACRQGIAVSSSSGDATNYAGWSNVIRGNIVDARNKNGTTSGYENAQYGINVNGFSNANQKNNRRVIVSENIIWGKGIVSSSGSGAIQAFGVERGIISDNIIESWGGTGIIAATASTLSISGNMVGGAASAGDTFRQCIRWHTGPGELTLTGNTHSPGSLNQAAHGFFSAVGTVTYPNGTNLVLASSGNAFMQASTGLSISGTYVSSDAGTNFAHAQLTTSSTAIDISRLTGSVVNVFLSANAAVSVSAITGSGLQGQIVIFSNTSANAITFTRSYAYLSGSVNQTLTNANDTIAFLNTGSNSGWVQISPALANG
jgi:hypothetical protein